MRLPSPGIASLAPLRRLHAVWVPIEDGAPGIDSKRPYGDRIYFVIDMADLLGEHVADSVKDARFETLHLETMAALQVCLCHGTLAAESQRRLIDSCDGRFVRER